MKPILAKISEWLRQKLEGIFPVENPAEIESYLAIKPEPKQPVIPVELPAEPIPAKGPDTAEAISLSAPIAEIEPEKAKRKKTKSNKEENQDLVAAEFIKTQMSAEALDILKEDAFDRYMALILDGKEALLTRKQYSEIVGVSDRTIFNWDQKIDWDFVTIQRRKKYKNRIVKIDDSVMRAASGPVVDIRAAELAYQRFDGWIPKSEQKTVHDIDESLIDAELKMLLESKQDTQAALAQTNADNSGNSANTGIADIKAQA